VIKCDVDQVINDDRRAAVRWTWRGTHTGELFGIAPIHRTIEFSETHFLRIPQGAGSLKITFPRICWICCTNSVLRNSQPHNISGCECKPVRAQPSRNKRD